MNWQDRLFVGIFAAATLTLCYLIFFEHQKKALNTQRIIFQIQKVQDLSDDLKDLAKNIQTKNAMTHINLGLNSDLLAMDKSFKMSLISEVIEVKAQMMSEACNDAIKELKKPLTFEIL